MKILNRAFNVREKILLCVLACILIGVEYYFLVELEVKENLFLAESEQQSIQMQLDVVDRKVQQLEAMKKEMDSVLISDSVSRMESYNNIKEEIRVLNDVLSASLKYDITFSDVTRKGNQIRRDVILKFTTGTYETAERMIRDLSNGPFRCLIKEINFSSKKKNLKNDNVQVSLLITYYETMFNGETDEGLPKDITKKNTSKEQDALSANINN